MANTAAANRVPQLRELASGNLASGKGGHALHLAELMLAPSTAIRHPPGSNRRCGHGA